VLQVDKRDDNVRRCDRFVLDDREDTGATALTTGILLATVVSAALLAGQRVCH